MSKHVIDKRMYFGLVWDVMFTMIEQGQRNPSGYGEDLAKQAKLYIDQLLEETNTVVQDDNSQVKINTLPKREREALAKLKKPVEEIPVEEADSPKKLQKLRCQYCNRVRNNADSLKRHEENFCKKRPKLQSNE